MRVTTGIQPAAASPRRIRDRRLLRREGIVVTVRLRRRRRSARSAVRPAAQLEIHDRRVKRWRHLDLGGQPLRDRVRAAPAALPGLRRCASRPVPWARPGRRPTRATSRTWWRGLAQQMAKTPIAGAAQDRLGHRRADRRARHRRPPRRAPPGRARGDRRRRDQLPPRAALPDHGRRPPHGRDRVVRTRAATRRPCRRSSHELGERKDVDPGGLDRHERRLPEAPSATRSRTPRSRLTRSTSPPREPGAPRPGPPRRVERPRALAHPDGQVGQGHPLVAAQGAREPDRLASSPPSAKSSRPTQRLYRAFLLKESSELLYHLDDPALAPGAPRRLAGLGIRSRLAPFVTPRPHPPPPPRRHPRRHPPRPHQRPPRGPQLQDPPHQPPQLRLPLRRRAHRPRLPLLRRRHHQPAPPMTHSNARSA